MRVMFVWDLRRLAHDAQEFASYSSVLTLVIIAFIIALPVPSNRHSRMHPDCGPWIYLAGRSDLMAWDVWSDAWRSNLRHCNVGRYIRSLQTRRIEFLVGRRIAFLAARGSRRSDGRLECSCRRLFVGNPVVSMADNADLLLRFRNVPLPLKGSGREPR